MLRNSNENSNLSANGQVPVNRIMSLLPKDWRRGNKVVVLILEIFVVALFVAALISIAMGAAATAKEVAAEERVDAEQGRIRYEHYEGTVEYIENIEKSLLAARTAIYDEQFEQSSPHLAAAANEIELLRDHLKNDDPFDKENRREWHLTEYYEGHIDTVLSVLQSITESADAGAVDSGQRSRVSSLLYAFQSFENKLDFYAEERDDPVKVGYISAAAYDAALNAVFSFLRQIQP